MVEKSGYVYNCNDHHTYKIPVVEWSDLLDGREYYLKIASLEIKDPDENLEDDEAEPPSGAPGSVRIIRCKTPNVKYYPSDRAIPGMGSQYFDQVTKLHKKSDGV